MMTLNRVMLAGNLTRDPELRRTPNGAAVAVFGLAANERFATRQGEQREEVCFVDIEIWGKQAETCCQYLTKGAPAFVEGRLRCDRWEDKQTGQRRSRLFVRADRVQFLHGARASDRMSEDIGRGGHGQEERVHDRGARADERRVA